LDMNLKTDAELLTFAKNTAANTSYSDNIRGQAFLLIAELGDKTNFDVLYQYVASDHVYLKLKALEAIANLQNKVSGTVQ